MDAVGTHIQTYDVLFHACDKYDDFSSQYHASSSLRAAATMWNKKQRLGVDGAASQ